MEAGGMKGERREKREEEEEEEEEKSRRRDSPDWSWPWPRPSLASSSSSFSSFSYILIHPPLPRGSVLVAVPPWSRLLWSLAPALSPFLPSSVSFARLARP